MAVRIRVRLARGPVAHFVQGHVCLWRISEETPRVHLDPQAAGVARRVKLQVGFRDVADLLTFGAGSESTDGAR